MPLSQPNSNDLLKTNWLTLSAGAFLGFIFSYAVFSGDQHGRVNLLYLLIVYLVIPVLGLIISLISLFRGQGVNLARLIQFIPLDNKNSNLVIRRLRQMKIEKHWFFLQSQLAAIAYSFASLLLFLILLLSTDINFVWRSTLLSAEDIFYVLKGISFPWPFWSSAQPTMELLSLTQDSRIASNEVSSNVYGRWWQFIFAVQIFYTLLPRLFGYAIAKWQIIRIARNDIESKLLAENTHSKSVEDAKTRKEFVSLIPEHLVITNWAGIDPLLLAKIDILDTDSNNFMQAGPTSTDAQQMVAERWQGEQVVVVKSWEPPLGELEDFLQNGRGYLLPLDWNGESLKKIQEKHLSEWIRFASQLADWQIFCPMALVPDNFAE